MRHNRNVWRAALWGAFLSCVAAAPTAGQGTASALTQAGQAVVIRGGWIFDAIADQRVPNRGILVRGGRFLVVGDPTRLLRHYRFSAALLHESGQP